MGDGVFGPFTCLSSPAAMFSGEQAASSAGSHDNQLVAAWVARYMMHWRKRHHRDIVYKAASCNIPGVFFANIPSVLPFNIVIGRRQIELTLMSCMRQGRFISNNDDQGGFRNLRAGCGTFRLSVLKVGAVGA